MFEARNLEVGKVYLLKHKTKAFGGGNWRAACKSRTLTHIYLGDRCYLISTVDEHFDIICCLGDYKEDE